MKSSMNKALMLMMAVGLVPTAMAQSSVPMLVSYHGVLKSAGGQPGVGVTGMTFLLYKEQEGGAPLWMETQNVTPDARGRYTVTLGATSSEGLPARLFADGAARWLAVQVAGQAEEARVALVAVPYAMKAKDADTIGGLPPSAFVLAGPAAPPTAAASSTNAEAAGDVSPDTACTGITSDGTATANQVAKFTAACAVEPSAIFESGGKVGIGTTTPAATLDVKGTAVVRSTLTMAAKGAATAKAGANSNPVDLLAASFDGSNSTSVSQHFRWQAEAAGNDTANPSGTLNLLYAPGSGTPAETGLSVNSAGLLTFAAGQTFPGAGTITGVTAGAGLSGGGAGGSVTLTNTGVLAVAGGTGITSSGGSAPTVSLNTGFTDGRYLQLAGGTLSGLLGLGQATPYTQLHIRKDVPNMLGPTITLMNGGGGPGTGGSIDFDGYDPGPGMPPAARMQSVDDGNYSAALTFSTKTPGGDAHALTERMRIDHLGNVGIGTAAPGAPLEVAGNVKISGTGSGLTFPDGTTQTTAGNPAGAIGVNPLQVALLRWYPVNQGPAIFASSGESVGGSNSRRNDKCSMGMEFRGTKPPLSCAVFPPDFRRSPTGVRLAFSRLVVAM